MKTHIQVKEPLFNKQQKIALVIFVILAAILIAKAFQMGDAPFQF